MVHIYKLMRHNMHKQISSFWSRKRIGNKNQCHYPDLKIALDNQATIHMNA